MSHQSSGTIETPALCFSMWSVRRKMNRAPIEAIEEIQEYKFPSVELAGFSTLRPIDLAAALSTRSIKVCGIHAPTISGGRDAEFYLNWCNRYTELFGCSNVALETTPTWFKGEAEHGIILTQETTVTLLFDIASRLNGRTLAYHCFPHDFAIVRGQSFVDRIMQRKERPGNFGFQIDTFWARYSNQSPDAIAALPITSVHLNERGANGASQQLGTEPEKCLHFVHEIVKHNIGVEWILENDSVLMPNSDEKSEAIRDNHDADVISNCLNEWPIFYKRAVEIS